MDGSVVLHGRGHAPWPCYKGDSVVDKENIMAAAKPNRVRSTNIVAYLSAKKIRS